MNDKLYRSTRDSKLMGLCAGIGEWLNVDITLIRVLFTIGVIFSGFTLLIPYFIIAMVIPKEPRLVYGYNFGYTSNQGCYGQNYHNQGHDTYQAHETYRKDYSQSSNQSSMDAMMADVEKKTMINEIQQLREKIAKIKKGE